MKDAKESHPTVEQWLEQAGFSARYRLQRLAGGDTSQTSLLTTKDGQQFCLKQNHSAPLDFFSCEAEGLASIAATKTVRVPRVFAVSPYFILMEYVEPGQTNRRYWEQLGEQLAAMHLQTREHFGFVHNNYCGSTAQINHTNLDGYAFFRDNRLLYQAKLALDKAQLTQQDIEHIAVFAGRLPELVPEQQPALLHGDLWAGNINIHCDSDGKPVLIDPAVYWGWPEADIAMTLLFGGFDEAFYQSYEAFRSDNLKPIEPGWRERAAIYNVYHLLNHANLFAGSYAHQAMRIVRRYC